VEQWKRLFGVEKVDLWTPPTILIGGKEQQLAKLEKKIYEFYSANVRTFTTLMKKLTEQTKDI
jgi:hypothetical protein